MTGNNDRSELVIIDPEREINYDPDILEYYLTVPNEYETWQENSEKVQDTSVNSTLQMYIKPDDENASYIINGPENLETGMNQLVIVVTAANGDIKTYVLNVYREKNSNVFLSDLEVKNNSTAYELTPEFNKINMGTYNVTVPNEIDNVEILAHAEASTTSVLGVGNKQLNTGNNEFKITTTSESGDTEIYRINVYREKNSNAYLRELHATNNENEYTLSPNFNKKTLEYSFSVDEGTTSIEISAAPEVSTTTYKLYVWIDESVTIGNTAGVDYQTNIWNNQVYASIKVNVNARTETNSSCFTLSNKKLSH